MSGLAGFFASEREVVVLCLTRVQGSSPREQGACMFVAPNSVWGTIGGGQLEYMAMDHARNMLRNAGRRDVMDVPLGPAIGQCCGGRVEVTLTRLTAAERRDALAKERADRAAQPRAMIFGAGHVGRALARALLPLPYRSVLIDSRPEELAMGQGDTLLTPLPEAEIRGAPAGAFFVIATHDHALDFLLASEALARRDAAYIGMIGSTTKRARFENWATGVDSSRLTCPMGTGHSRDKRPEVIAALIAAEMLTVTAKTSEGMEMDRG
ncbi:MAG: xanthine dehydrogenase accessory protein XdhC [Rhodobacterales bacterium]|nr:MAG: xanthine dehydrogenase accessory protein XdhC [Rhodobacterales bacterium]